MQYFHSLKGRCITESAEQDMEDFEMYDLVVKDLAEFKDWSGFDQIGKLISYVYQQVEATEFD